MALFVLEALNVISISNVRVNDIAALFRILRTVIYYDWAIIYEL